MRPLKLVMNAFGPYKEKVEIDFTQFNQQTLFLVSGPTGAGKTTIFDGIAYALYDSASGESRGKDSFKSQFATDEDLCYVELEFELAGETYYVKRIPAQTGPGKRGTKNYSSEVEFIHGNSVTTKINDANQEIEALLSLNYDQFKQIVMLPQGEFKKMLESNSGDKEKIFRNIFQTSFVKEFQNMLKSKTSELKKEAEQSDKIMEQIISTVQAEEDEELQEAISLLDVPVLMQALERISTNYANQILEGDNQVKALQIQQQQNQAVIDLLTEAATLEKAKVTLESRKTEVDGFQLQLTLSEKASTCLETKQQLHAISQEMNQKQALFQQDMELLKQVQTDLQENKALFKEAEVLYHNLPQTREALEEARQQEKSLHVIQEKQKQINDLKTAVSDSEEAIKKRTFKKEELQQESSQLQQQLSVIKQAWKDLQKEQETEHALKNQLSQQQEREKQLKAMTKLLKDQRRKVKTFHEAEGAYQEAEHQYRHHRTIFNRNLAGILAADLEENQACMVCGSVHHPQPAVMTEDSTTKEELERLEEAMTQRSQEYNTVSAEVHALNQRVVEYEQELYVSAADAETTLEDLEEAVSNLQNELQQLQTKLAELKKSVEQEAKVEESMQALQEKERILDSEVQEAQSSIKHNENRMQEIKEEMTELQNELKQTDLGEIQETVRRLEKEVQKTEAEYKKLQEQSFQLEKKETQYATSVSSYQEHLTELTVRHEEWASKLQLKLTEAGLDESFEQHLLDELKTGQLKEQVAKFEQESWVNEDNLKRTQLKLQSMGDVKTMEVYQEENEATFLQLEQLDSRRREWIGSHKNCETARIQISEHYKAKKKQQEQYRLYSDLSELANGSKETDYISFERYILAIYFEEIIEAANHRFKQMTTGRYSLLRKEEATKGAGPKGLDLDVFDNYTGKKRSVKTLSGGEGFKASLALALGLSDVIQNHSGGVSMDTLFIDEGFGTLDSDSLDGAIETLFELNQKGRLVGIISHVEELKTRIPVHIEVTKTSEGSKTKVKL